jgi:DedD protein
MAFFKSRKGGDETAAVTRQPESIEVMRKRAKHRLIGAAVLVLVGVIGFPLLFDTQPRPIDTDIPIEIPDRNKVKPLPPAAPPAAKASVTQAPAASGAVMTGLAASAAKAQAPAAVPESKAETKPEPKVEAVAEPKRSSKPAESKPAKPEAKPEPRRDDGAKALALLEGKPVAIKPAVGEGRFVVQVGAFADAGKAREARLKVEKAGLKTYTHIAEGKEGKLIRVRVGPFGTKAEAEKVAEKVKTLNGKAAVLAL